jgi:hypothetical protein
MENHQPEILNYQGYLSYQITGKLIEDLRDISQQMNLKKSTYRKIVTLMVEIIENNYNYVNALDEEIRDKLPEKPFFSLIQSGDHYILRSGNPILKDDAEKLKKRIEHINQLRYEQLKELYKKTMARGIYEKRQKAGAGLGIMKMAKISKNKIHYQITNLHNDLYFYTIEIAIPKKS